MHAPCCGIICVDRHVKFGGHPTARQSYEGGPNKLAGTKAAKARRRRLGVGLVAVVASLRCLSLHAQMAAPTHRITVPPVLMIDFTIPAVAHHWPQVCWAPDSFLILCGSLICFGIPLEIVPRGSCE